MTEEEKILEALQVQVPPNLPATFVDEAMVPSTDNLIYLIKKELSDTLASSSLFEKYLQDPGVWHGAMIDVIQELRLTEKQELMAEVDSILRVAEQMHPINRINDDEQ